MKRNLEITKADEDMICGFCGKKARNFYYIRYLNGCSDFGACKKCEKLLIKKKHWKKSNKEKTVTDEFNKQMAKVAAYPLSPMAEEEMKVAVDLMNSSSNTYDETPCTIIEQFATLNNAMINVGKCIKESSTEYIKLFRRAYGIKDDE